MSDVLKNAIGIMATKDGKRWMNNENSLENVDIVGEKTAFWRGFEKAALTKKLLARASRVAGKARDAVHEAGRQGRPFHGPIAAKFDAQSRLFDKASRGNRKMFNRDRLKVRAGKFTHTNSGGRIKNMFKEYFEKNHVKSKDVLEVSKDLK